MKAVIFDLDGCLVDSETLAIGAITDEMREMGINDVTFEEIRSRFLGVSMRIICEEVGKRTGRGIGSEFVERVEARLFARYARELRQIAGAEAMLDSFRKRGIAMAIATGGSIRRMGETVRMGGLTPWFDGAAFSADQVANGKPAPDLFLFAAEQLGVAPADCVVLEDSPHGVRGAVAAGMSAVGFVGGSHLNGMEDDHAAILQEAGAARVFKRLEDVNGYVLAKAI
ncbi:HAD-IA family hydrolase [Algicella marina]|uniref:HAD-IA family hydrolase n=1 Tax=Algicella marina TaxID=2683284 RepID=A0A6P1T754_9RHOB|nr:HAD-IA family hydrolase [Algicella marina]